MKTYKCKYPERIKAIQINSQQEGQDVFLNNISDIDPELAQGIAGWIASNAQPRMCLPAYLVIDTENNYGIWDMLDFNHIYEEDSE